MGNNTATAKLQNGSKFLFVICPQNNIHKRLSQKHTDDTDQTDFHCFIAQRSLFNIIYKLRRRQPRHLLKDAIESSGGIET